MQTTAHKATRQLCREGYGAGAFALLETISTTWRAEVRRSFCPSAHQGGNPLPEGGKKITGHVRGGAKQTVSTLDGI